MCRGRSDPLFVISHVVTNTWSGCRLLSTEHEADQCLACEEHHEHEAALLEDVSRLLDNVRASVRWALVAV